MPTEPPPGERPRVIIADDSADQRWLVRHMLEPFGFPLTEVSDGRGLFWALHRLRPSGDTGRLLVVADVYMPVYDALTVLEARRLDGWAYPFVVMTSFPDPSVIQRVRDLDALLLPKPFTLFDLLEVVRKLGLITESEARPWQT